MNGIFANRLHSVDFCFERLSACKCRSSQKTPPRDYSKNPFAGDLGKSSEEKNRLLDLMKLGCHCPKNTVKERWFHTNQHIIFALAAVLERPPNVVSDFLYSLTLQNFSKILNPGVSPGSYCKVPFVFSNACDDYMSLFDTHGNIRSRFSQDSLKLLMRVIQTWLKNGSHKNGQPFKACLADARCKSKDKEIKAKKAGIDRDSVARQNGQRRLREADARAHLSRSRLRDPTNLNGGHGHICGSNFPPAKWNDYQAEKPNDRDHDNGLMTSRLTESKMRARLSPFQGTFRNGDPGYVFGMNFDPNEFEEDSDRQETKGSDPDDKRFGRLHSAPGGLGELGDYDELAAERSRRLEDLLFQLNQKTFLTRDIDKLIRAIKHIKLEKPKRNSRKSADDFTHDSTAAKIIADSYYEKVRDSQFHPKKPPVYNFSRKNASHDTQKKQKQGKLKLEAEDQRASTGKMYYGEPIPVLMHEPYDRDKPWTWLRRHPNPERMDDKGEMVSNKNIRRYRRETVDLEMQKARTRDSVYTVYSLGEEDDASSSTLPIFGQKPGQKPAQRSSLGKTRDTRGPHSPPAGASW